MLRNKLGRRHPVYATKNKCIRAREREIASMHHASVLTVAILTLGLIIASVPLLDAAEQPTVTPRVEPSRAPLASPPAKIAQPPPLKSSHSPRAQAQSFINREAAPIYVIAQIVTASAQAAAIFGLFVGGIWALILYRLNRTPVPRLQLKLRSDILRLKGSWCLFASFEVKNIGSRIVEFREPSKEKQTGGPGGCSIILIPLVTRAKPLKDMSSLIRQQRHVHDILKLYRLERHKTVEPGISIREHVLLQLPEELDRYDAFEVQLRVSIQPISWRQRLFLLAPRDKEKGRFLTNVMVFRGPGNAVSVDSLKEENGDGSERLSFA